MWEMQAFQALSVVCVTVAFVASLRFLRRIVELKYSRSIRSSTDGLAERLDRIEAAVETTALEVERISEANRFVAKLLADRSDPGRPLGSPERVITPH